MSVVAATPYQSALDAGRDGFVQRLHAEWTKFRSIRSWTVTTAVAALLMVLLGVLSSSGSHSTYNGTQGHPYVPVGPGGEAVTDEFSLASQVLSGNGTLTARLTSLAGAEQSQSGSATGAGQPTMGAPVPWAKAGLIVKQSTKRGSAYAAVMATGGHGVRMQYNYTGDIAGPSGTVSAGSPRWLRLTRVGDTITGYASTDGATWTTVGTVQLATAAKTVQIGMFVASPGRVTVDEHLGGGGESIVSTVGAAVFDHVKLAGSGSTGAWTGTIVGARPQQPAGTPLRQSGDEYTLTGSGDIAPGTSTGGPFDPVLVGTFAALAALAVLGVLFITTEYRRGLIRTSLTSDPRRGRLLAAKAVVVTGPVLLAGTLGVAAGLLAGRLILPGHGFTAERGYAPLSLADGPTLRAAAGSVLYLALIGLFSLGIAALLRDSAAAMGTVLGLLYLLPALLHAVSDPTWQRHLEQIAPTPAGLTIEATIGLRTLPLSPWAGLGVLAAWAVGALIVGAGRLAWRDA